jgi:3D (Asp-Asp-Asp) domain-containing protein
MARELRLLGPRARGSGQFVFVSMKLSIAVVGGVVSSCGAGSGAAWMAEPLVREPPPQARALVESQNTASHAEAPHAYVASTLGEGATSAPSESEPPPQLASLGTFVGVFRNTYYDFPRESDYDGARVPIMSSSCSELASVPRAFFEAVCVQGSGLLARGGTVSFARRDCECAEVCPRTGQRICFDALDAARFPWGRGAAGRAITPLLTIAADTTVLPLGTPVYIAEFDGVVREDSGDTHDGCLVVEDRGIRVQGLHVDVFTGSESMTRALGRVVPSNIGVRVHTGAPKCERLKTTAR